MAVWRLTSLTLLLVPLLTLDTASCRNTEYTETAGQSRLFIGNSTQGVVRKCYGVYGCFAITSKWISFSRPVSLLPQSPKKIGVSFCLYTSNNRDCQMMYDTNITSIMNSTFLAGRKTKILAHGYLDSGQKKWIKLMVSELVKLESMNVLVVNWVGGSGPPYTQAVANIRVVGAVVGRFIVVLKKLGLVEPCQVHVIGHSLGSHLAGYVGSYLNEHGLRLGRITGLDPAEPHFENTEPVVRLDPSDAELVDVIHTDGGPIISGGLGLVQPIGHMDFFPNGGVKQPGCGASVFEAIKTEAGSLVYGLRRFIGCNHLRAYEYFTESISNKNKCHFTAIKCDSFERFKTGECGLCHWRRDNCRYMGYYADKGMNSSNNSSSSSSVNRETTVRTGESYFLLTGKHKPFCREQYGITLRLSNSSEAVQHGGDTGTVSARLKTANGRVSDWFQVNSQEWLAPGGRHRRTVAVALTAAPVALQLRWQYTASPFNPLTWRLLSQPVLHVRRLSATRLSDARRFIFSGGDRALRSGYAMTLPLVTVPTAAAADNADTTAADNAASAADNYNEATDADTTAAAVNDNGTHGGGVFSSSIRSNQHQQQEQVHQSISFTTSTATTTTAAAVAATTTSRSSSSSSGTNSSSSSSSESSNGSSSSNTVTSQQLTSRWSELGNGVGVTITTTPVHDGAEVRLVRHRHRRGRRRRQRILHWRWPVLPWKHSPTTAAAAAAAETIATLY